VRTVKRDVSALQQGGFPVWARLGRVGGYVVDASATLPPVNITETEASALAAALAAHRGQPFSAHGRTAIERALHERRVLAIRYRDNDDRVTSRRVDPQLLASTGGHWYLVAHCRLRQGVRWFRLDRVEAASVTAEVANDLPIADLGQPPARASSLAPLAEE